MARFLLKMIQCLMKQKFLEKNCLPGSLAFTTPVPIAITIRREMTVPASRVPMITSFAFLSKFADKRFGRP